MATSTRSQRITDETTQRTVQPQAGERSTSPRPESPERLQAHLCLMQDELAALKRSRNLVAKGQKERLQERIAATEAQIAAMTPPALPFEVGAWVVSTSRKFTGKAQIKFIYPDNQVLLHQRSLRMIARREHLRVVEPDAIPTAPIAAVVVAPCSAIVPVAPAVLIIESTFKRGISTPDPEIMALLKQAEEFEAQAAILLKSKIKNERAQGDTLQLRAKGIRLDIWRKTDPDADKIQDIQVGDFVEPNYSEGYWYKVLAVNGKHLEIDKKAVGGRLNVSIGIKSVSIHARRDGRIIRVR